MRRSSAGAEGEQRTVRDGAEANAARPSTGDEGVKVAPLPGSAVGIVTATWVVSREGRELLRFDGDGADARAGAFASGVREEIRRGTYAKVRARGRCRFGHPCDRDRLNVPRLRDASDDLLGRVALCPEHLAEARPGAGKASSGPVAGSGTSGQPAGGSGTQGLAPAGRRRKAGVP